MTVNPSRPLVVLALVAVIAAAAAWPPAQAAGRFVYHQTVGAYQAKFFDSQSFRFSCM